MEESINKNLKNSDEVSVMALGFKKGGARVV
jgi:hypothetical protein